LREAPGVSFSGDAADFPTFEDGHVEVVIVEAVLRSHERQAWVDVSAH
jgi:hypothetical protein